jgi:hypothetical protein
LATETGQAHHAEHAHCLRSLSDSVGRDQCAVAWAAGSRITLDEAVADAPSVVGKTIDDIRILAGG